MFIKYYPKCLSNRMSRENAEFHMSRIAHALLGEAAICAVSILNFYSQLISILLSLLHCLLEIKLYQYCDGNDCSLSE